MSALARATTTRPPAGEPLASALRAATAVVQNLRRKGPFALITFDAAAEVVIPTGPVSNQPAVLDRIEPAALSAALPDGVVGVKSGSGPDG